MRPGGGKNKGSSFEREVCKDLSLWLTNGKSEDCLWRSSISGGRATVAHRKGKLVRQAGDICAVTPEGHKLTDKWFIECKHVRKLRLDRFLLENKGTLAKFWRTAKTEAKKYKRDPMIIAKQNAWPILVVTRTNHLAHWVQPRIRGVGFDISMYSELLKVPFGER